MNTQLMDRATLLDASRRGDRAGARPFPLTAAWAAHYVGGREPDDQASEKIGILEWDEEYNMGNRVRDIPESEADDLLSHQCQTLAQDLLPGQSAADQFRRGLGQERSPASRPDRRAGRLPR
jgi:hypothetical protein